LTVIFGQSLEHTFENRRYNQVLNATTNKKMTQIRPYLVNVIYKKVITEDEVM
jgi:hypothetical protein